MLWVSGYSQHFNFRNYSVEEGVAQSQIYSIIQDSKGYLWMGTRGGGINRYDGLKFKSYSQKDGLCSNYIFCLKEDKNNKIWIGTNNGFSIYNGIEFKSYSYGHSDTTQMWVLDIEFDKKGDAYLATNYGLVLFSNGKFRNLTQELGEKPTMINTLTFDNQQKLWYGSNFGLNVLTLSDGKFKIKKYNKNPNYIKTSVNSLLFDEGILWVGTYNDGIYTFKNDTFTALNSDLFAAKQSVFDIYADQKQNIWMATLNIGVIQYNKQTKSYTVLGEKEGLSNNHVRSICSDQAGNLWFGTSGGGVCNYFGNRFTNYDQSSGLAGNFIYSIFRDSKNRLIVGNSDKGISIFDSGRISNYNNTNGFHNIKVKAISEDNFGRVYLGTEANGLYILEKDSFYSLNEFNKKYIKSIVKDLNGNMIIAGTGTGIYRIMCQKNDSSIQQLSIQDGLLSNRISSLHVDKKGRIWYGTDNHGLSYLNDFKPSHIKINTLNGMPSNAIRCIIENKNGLLYVGTAGSGIVEIPIYEGELIPKTIDDKDGLSSSNIYLLTIDEAGSLYAGSENGIDQITFNSLGKIDNIKHYSKGEGFIGIETCQNSVWNDKDKSIWFGTINGLTNYKSYAQFKNHTPPSTNITEVKLFYTPLSKTAFKDVIGDWNHINNLRLPYNQNHLTFDFQGINFSNPEAVVYRWKLEGFDKEWSPISNQNTVTYSNLPNGNYVFKVMASNEDGIWNSVPEQLFFTIDSPYWKKWWVIILFSIFIGGIVVFLFRLRIKNIRQKAKEEQEQLKVEKMILELEQKALRLQMNPHFIFNALNSIQSQIGTDNEQTARYYLAKFSRLMRQILDNSRQSLISLELEINTLENYLLIEKFSNGDRFDYHIEVDSQLETDFIEIPPMMLQPFIENSIKHGLKNQDKKRGRIDINISENEGILECKVTDNGIGREQSAILNSKSKETYHESTALKVTHERLEIFKIGRNYKALEIIDLKDEQNNAVGTQVILRIPIQ